MSKHVIYHPTITQMYIFISHLSPAYVFCIFPLKDAFDLYPVVFDEVSVNIKNKVKIVTYPCLCKHNCSDFLVNIKYNHCGAYL